VIMSRKEAENRNVFRRWQKVDRDGHVARQNGGSSDFLDRTSRLSARCFPFFLLVASVFEHY